MSTLLSNEFVLQEVVNRLPVTQKFAIQSVSRLFKRVSRICLRRQKKLVILDQKDLPANYDFFKASLCQPCSVHDELTLMDAISFPGNDALLFSQLLNTMCNLEIVFVEKCCVHLNNLVFRTQKDSLSCFYGPYVFATDIGDESLQFPQLQHLDFGKSNIDNKSLKKILTSYPRLSSLTFGTTYKFQNWDLLPQGFKRLVCSDIPVDSFSSLIASDTVQSLEELTLVNIAPDTLQDWTRNEFPQLQRLGIRMTENIKDSFESLVKFLCCPSRNRKRLSLFLKMYGYTGVDVLPNSTWNKLLHNQDIQILDLTIKNVNIESSIEEFIQDLVSSMKQLRKIEVDFPLSDKCLLSLSSLDHLEILGMDNVAKRPYPPHQSICGTRGLMKFLNASFAKNLFHFESSFDLMQVPASFIQELYALCDQQSLRMNIIKYPWVFCGSRYFFRVSYLDLLKEFVRGPYKNFH